MNTTASENRPWMALENTGTQSFTYADVQRKDLHMLFASAPQNVLDIGCATGAVGVGIKNSFQNARVLGCELDMQAAKIAKQRLDQVITAPLREWNTEQIQDLQKIDTVMLLDVLEHMYNPWAELEFLSKHLNKNAQLIISLPNIGHLSTFNQLHQGFWRYDPFGIKDITHLRFFTEYEMIRMFYQTGFKVEQKIYLAVPPNLTKFEQYPITINVGNGLQMQVRNNEHWLQLNAIQLGFRIRIASDDELSPKETELRHGSHITQKKGPMVTIKTKNGLFTQ